MGGHISASKCCHYLRRMMMLYIHIPFCAQKCIYCDFYSIPQEEMVVDRYIRAVGMELKQERALSANKSVSTVYIGGGTPSSLSVEQLENLFKEIGKAFDIQSSAEITLEANPEDLSLDYLKRLKAQTPINRLSIGVQSFDDQILKKLNRRHTAQRAFIAIADAQDVGFENLSIDLIYALPKLSFLAWEETLQRACSLGIKHLSSYCLTVAEGTVLEQQIRRGKYQSPEDESSLAQFDHLIKIMEEHGFEQYEISNFAKPGYASRHNQGYWMKHPYLGIGASAHGFDGEHRKWNTSSVKDYIHALENNLSYSERETLTDVNQYNESIYLGLRTRQGVDRAALDQRFIKELEKNIPSLIEKGWIVCSGSHFRLTKQGMHVADYITELLFCTPSA